MTTAIEQFIKWSEQYDWGNRDFLTKARQLADEEKAGNPVRQLIGATRHLIVKKGSRQYRSEENHDDIEVNTPQFLNLTPQTGLWEAMDELSRHRGRRISTKELREILAKFKGENHI